MGRQKEYRELAGSQWEGKRRHEVIRLSARTHKRTMVLAASQQTSQYIHRQSTHQHTHTHTISLLYG